MNQEEVNTNVLLNNENQKEKPVENNLPTTEVAALDTEAKTSVQNNSADKVNETKADQKDSNEAETANEEKWEDLLGSGSIMKRILKQGQPGTRPVQSQSCCIRYKCQLADGTVVEQQDNFELELGAAEVVQGLDVAIGLMDVGEVCLLKIEARLAYGSKGLDDADSHIPPNETVCFEVELLKVLPDEELEELTIVARQEKGKKKRERGNWWYKRGENQLAIQCYRKALDYLDEVEGGIKYPDDASANSTTDHELQKLLESRLMVYNNMAAAQIKLQLYDAALQSLQNVLRCQPENVKALFRKAKIYRAKNDVPLAIKILKKSLSYSPNDKDLVSELASLEKLQQKQKESEKNLARKMFGDINNSNVENSKHTSSSKLYVWATVGASVTVGILGLLVYRLRYNV